MSANVKDVDNYDFFVAEQEADWWTCDDMNQISLLNPETPTFRIVSIRHCPRVCQNFIFPVLYSIFPYKEHEVRDPACQPDTPSMELQTRRVSKWSTL